MLAAETSTKVILLSRVLNGRAVELAARSPLPIFEVVPRTAHALLRIVGRSHRVRDGRAIGLAATLLVRVVVCVAEADAAGRLHVGRTLALVCGRAPLEAGQAGALARFAQSAGGVRNLSAVELTSAGEGVPAPVVVAGAGVKARLQRQRICY